MRFMVMHKVDAHMEAGGPPSQEIIQSMGALVQESLKQGIFLNGAGLHRSAQRARLKGAHGPVTRGPYQGDNELVASVAMISTRSIDQAIAFARELSSSLGDAEIEVGPVWSGPAVSRGRVYVGGGNVLFSSPDAMTLFPHGPNGVLISLGLPGEDEVSRLGGGKE